MFLSVMVPVYNAEKYLDQCISSILAQTETDFELILVDDGSTDRSAAICKQWAKKYPEIVRYIYQENGGELLARRRGLLESRGEYLYFVDADDYLLEERAFEVIRQTIEATSCDYLFFDLKNCVSQKNVTHFSFQDKEQFEGEALNLVYRLLIETGLFNNIGNKVFHRDLIDWEMDYKPYAPMVPGADLFQMIPVIFHAQKMIYLNEAFYGYRFGNPDNASHHFHPETYVSLKHCFEQLVKCAGESPYITPEVRSEVELRRCLTLISALYQLLLIKKSDPLTPYEYVKGIGEDRDFLKKPTKAIFAKLSTPHRLTLWLLYHKCYRLTVLGIQLYGWKKGRWKPEK